MEGLVGLLATELTILVGTLSFYFGLRNIQERREVKLQKLICQGSKVFAEKVIVIEDSDDMMGRAVIGHFTLGAAMAFLAPFAHSNPRFIYYMVGVLLVFPIWYLFFKRLNTLFVATTEGIAQDIDTNFYRKDDRLTLFAWDEIDRVKPWSDRKNSPFIFKKKQIDEREYISFTGAFGGIPRSKLQELAILINQMVPPERIDPRIREYLNK